jgi:hypothetical protein
VEKPLAVMPARTPTRLASPNTKQGPYKGYGKKIQEAFAAIVPDDADVGAVAEAIVKVVDAPLGKRPFRVHIDPTRSASTFAALRANVMIATTGQSCGAGLLTSGWACSFGSPDESAVPVTS